MPKKLFALFLSICMCLLFVAEIRPYKEFADVDAANATQALTIVIDEKVVAVYII